MLGWNQFYKKFKIQLDVATGSIHVTVPISINYKIDFKTGAGSQRFAVKICRDGV